MSAVATIRQYHRNEANMLPTRLAPTVLGVVLIVEAGGISYLRFRPWIMSLMVVLQIAAIVGVGGCWITTPGRTNTQNNTPRLHNNQIV